nr:MAG TPA: protein of unknown function (DUF4342) [Caudoviricetes sp.]
MRDTHIEYIKSRSNTTFFVVKKQKERSTLNIWNIVSVTGGVVCLLLILLFGYAMTIGLLSGIDEVKRKNRD